MRRYRIDSGWYRVVVAVVAVAAMVACMRTDESLDIHTLQYIAFDADISTTTVTTRGTVIDNTNKNTAMADFGVFAYNYDNTTYKVTEESPFEDNNQKVERSDDDSGWSYTPLAEWPEGVDNIMFYAYAPYVDEDESGAITNLRASSSELTLDYVMPEDVKEHLDILVSEKSYGVAGEAVMLLFRHQLAAVQINIMNNPSWQVTNLTLAGVVGKGELTADIDEGESEWTLSEDTADKKSFDIAVDYDIADYAQDEEIAVASGDDSFIIIPQSLTSESVLSVTIERANSSTQETATVSLLLSDVTPAWIANNIYTYTLEIENGSVAFVDMDIKEWGDEINIGFTDDGLPQRVGYIDLDEVKTLDEIKAQLASFEATMVRKVTVVGEYWSGCFGEATMTAESESTDNPFITCLTEAEVLDLSGMTFADGDYLPAYSLYPGSDGTYKSLFTEIILPDDNTYLTEGLLYGCSSLLTIDFGGTTIFCQDALNGCWGVNTLRFSSQGHLYYSQDATSSTVVEELSTRESGYLRGNDYLFTKVFGITLPTSSTSTNELNISYLLSEGSESFSYENNIETLSRSYVLDDTYPDISDNCMFLIYNVPFDIEVYAGRSYYINGNYEDAIPSSYQACERIECIGFNSGTSNYTVEYNYFDTWLYCKWQSITYFGDHGLDVNNDIDLNFYNTPALLEAAIQSRVMLGYRRPVFTGEYFSGAFGAEDYSITSLPEIEIGYDLVVPSNHYICKPNTASPLYKYFNEIVNIDVSGVNNFNFDITSLFSVDENASVNKIVLPTIEVNTPTDNAASYEDNTVVKIPDLAFGFCTNLSDISLYDLDGNDVLNSSVTSIGHGAFIGCKDLEFKAPKYGTPPPIMDYIGDYAFYDCDNLIYLSGTKSLSSYMKDNYFNIASINSIGRAAFAGCDNFQGMHNLSTYSTKVGSIGDYAFAYNKSLENIAFDPIDSYISIGEYAFAGNIACKEVKLPITTSNSVSLGKGAFKDNTSLCFVTIVASELPDECFKGAVFALDEDGDTFYEGSTNQANLTISKTIKYGASCFEDAYFSSYLGYYQFIINGSGSKYNHAAYLDISTPLSTVEELGDRCFAGTSGYLYIGPSTAVAAAFKNVTKIGAYIFDGVTIGLPEDGWVGENNGSYTASDAVATRYYFTSSFPGNNGRLYPMHTQPANNGTSVGQTISFYFTQENIVVDDNAFTGMKGSEYIDLYLYSDKDVEEYTVLELREMGIELESGIEDWEDCYMWKGAVWKSITTTVTVNSVE